jgi:hypothetical protein
MKYDLRKFWEYYLCAKTLLKKCMFKMYVGHPMHKSLVFKFYDETL